MRRKRAPRSAPSGTRVLGRTGPARAREDAKLMFGMLFSLKQLMNKANPLP